jgi:glucan phosphoethanolaminetransferase (alkaline phosphatase superfamily)
VEELLAVGVGFAVLALLCASIVIFMFGSLSERRAKVALKALAACGLALYVLAALAAVRSWMGGGLAETWSGLARGAFYSALAVTTSSAAFAIAVLVGRRLERMSPESARRFEKAFLIAFIVSAIAMMAMKILRHR